MEMYLPLLMFLALFLGILLGFPVAFTLGGVAIIFGWASSYLDLFYTDDFAFIPSRVFGIVKNLTLIAVPLFVFMGITLEKSGLAQELLESMQVMFRRVKGGLAISVVFVGALLAASTGIVGATVVTMGVMALPTMIKWGYQKELSCGTIAAPGTLGQIIPPSIVLVLLGDMMNVDVAELFVGAMLPGFLMVLLYAAYIFIRIWTNPNLAPVPKDLAMEQGEEGIGFKLFLTLIPPALLMIIVLGSILGGFASPTEASACGAVGALLLSGIKGRLSWQKLKEIGAESAKMTSMVFTILVGAQFFGVVFRGLEGDAMIESMILDHEIPKAWVLLCVMLLMFVMGFFLDFIEICFIIIPIVAPLLVKVLGYDALWLAILMAINLQTSFLTPPFGFALFYLKGVAPPDVKTSHIYKGIIPFVLLQMLALVLIYCFPELVTALPRMVFD
jgi:tripartite ATP-independent transporter DctM subunit